MSDLRENVQRLIREGRLAHAYILRGNPKGNGLAFANELICDLFSLTTEEPEERVTERIENRIHPDVVWVEPSSAMRQIRVKDLEPVMQCINTKSFEGGWKVTVFVHADRFNEQTANKFLKTLEEPPDKTLILMLTDAPEQILATIRSRCQFLNAPGGGAEPDPDWQEPLLELLSMGPPRSLLERLARCGQFKELFEMVGDRMMEELDLEESDVVVDDAVVKGREASIRRGVYREMAERIERWYRDVLVAHETREIGNLRYKSHAKSLLEQAETLKPVQIHKLIENSRLLARRLETNLPLQVAFESAVV